jgi:UDP-3-O-[3-hydroxymyristoyl] glucosamine N-acyltransferase
MADKRFYQQSSPLFLEQLAKIGEAELRHPLPSGLSPESLIYDIGTLEEATSRQVAVLHNMKYLKAFTKSKAGACVVSPEAVAKAPCTMALLVSNHPYRAYALMAAKLYSKKARQPLISKSAYIDSTAKIGMNCTIEEGVVLASHVEVGNNTCIQANTVIESGVLIGHNCGIGANVTISHSLIGDNVVILPGARIGQAGFGFAMDEKGHVPVPQVGRVIIGNKVEIGANTTIDRGSVGDTIIGEGSRIDNLVQIAHNVELGRGCVIVAQVGIAGSSKLEEHVIAAGQAGISGHLHIGKRAKIAAQSGLMKNVKESEIVAGCPAVPVTMWHRQNVVLARLACPKKKKIEST